MTPSAADAPLIVPASVPEQAAVPARGRGGSGGKRGGGGASRGYKKGAVYLRPDSKASRALATLVAESARAGHALTFAAWRDAHQQATGEYLHDLDGIAASLKRRGLIADVGPRARAAQYTAAAAPTPPAPEADAYDVLVDVVTTECACSGGAVPLEIVCRALSARGLHRSSDQVSTMLDGISAPPSANSGASTPAAAGEGAATVAATPRLEVLHETGAHAARVRRFWRPAGSAYEAPTTAPATRAAAFRASVVAASDALGRPVSPVEIKAWAATHAAHPAAAATGIGASTSRYTAALRTVLDRDEARGDGLEDCSHPLATDGGIPLRVGVAVDTIDGVVARFTDACAWLRPTVEFELGARVRDAADRPDSPGLRTLAHVREMAMLRAIAHDLATCEGRRFDPTSASESWSWPMLVERTAAAAAALQDWWRASAKARHPRAPRWVLDAQEAARAAELVAEHSRGMSCGWADAPSLQLAGHAGYREHAEVEAWLREILYPTGQTFGTAQPHLARVRRFPNPRCVRGPLHDPARENFSVLDVGDVLWRLSELASDPHVSVLLQSAVYLLGTAVRDPGPLLVLLDRLPLHDGYHRRGAAVALGALGVLVDPEVVLAGPDDVAGLEAYALAVGLLPGEPSDRAAHLRALAGEVTRGLRERLDEFVDRAAAGDRVTIGM